MQDRRLINKMQLKITLGLAIFITLWIITTTIFVTQEAVHFKEQIISNSKNITALQNELMSINKDRQAINLKLLKISSTTQDIKNLIERNSRVK